MSEIKPQFSVVIPVYNRAHSVLPALRSVQTQTCADFECIVVDDGSEDGDALKTVVLGLDDSRFHYVRQDNGGGGAARNTGIDLAKGAWIALLDSDDLFKPRKLEVLSATIARDPTIDVLYHSTEMDRGDGSFQVRPYIAAGPGETIVSRMFRERDFVQTSTLAVRAPIAKAVRFDPNLRKLQDVDFVFRLEKSGVLFQFVPEILSVWNDQAVDGRIGAKRNPTMSEYWYQKNRHLMSIGERKAFMATYYSYEIAGQNKFLAVWHILSALFGRHISSKIAVACLLRALLPQSFFRRITAFAIGGRQKTISN